MVTILLAGNICAQAVEPDGPWVISNAQVGIDILSAADYRQFPGDSFPMSVMAISGGNSARVDADLLLGPTSLVYTTALATQHDISGGSALALSELTVEFSLTAPAFYFFQGHTTVIEKIFGSVQGDIFLRNQALETIHHLTTALTTGAFSHTGILDSGTYTLIAVNTIFISDAQLQTTTTEFGLTLMPVPEPHAFSLIAAGVSLLFLRRFIRGQSRVFTPD